jgi:ribosomal protein S30
MALLLHTPLLIMFKRQFSLLVMATLLLSPSLVHANESNEDTNISVGNIRVQTNSRGTSIQTPGINVNTGSSDGDRIETSGDGVSIQTPRIQIKTAKPTIDRTYISRNRRRFGVQVVVVPKLSMGKVVSLFNVRDLVALQSVSLPRLSMVAQLVRLSIVIVSDESHTIF